MTKYYVGIDTSAYTTSLAVIDEKNNIILDSRRLLKVREGYKGLRQQEAVFQHINNLPLLIERMTNEIDISKIVAISCSSKPRNIEESYMPVFVVGKGQAFILSKVLSVNYEEFSHQEGHIGAGILNNKLKDCSKFISLHISGGTTELLLVEIQKASFKVQIIGGTLDISVGQLIDRIGVQLGMDFPCGREMDAVSERGSILDLRVPINIKDNTWFNLSGMENYFKNLIESQSYKMEDLVKSLFNTISCFIYKIIINSCIQYNINNVLITGGVASNRFIREYLSMVLNKEKIDIYFPKMELCTDNGIGIAYMGKKKYISG
jgi:N6-L-threonylcarbamoyladenine synthase